MSIEPPEAIATPCVKLCVVDGESGLCLGCLRTLSEITDWSRMDAATRAALMDELHLRATQISPTKLGLV